MAVSLVYDDVEKSHPLRMRGLKPIWSQQRTWRKESHPLRMRGLKLE